MAARQQQPNQIQYVGSGSGGVAVNPNQPYRPIPANRAQSRETIFEFYMKTLNPRQINWGDEIDRRAAVLIEQSISSRYFAMCVSDGTDSVSSSDLLAVVADHGPRRKR